jgi:DNA repair protein RecN (Recombination protein N)
MLVHLKIRDLVLIDELDIELSAEFNVLTGETGAGKSLVATAVDLLLGRRATGDIVRRESKEAEVEGLFDISDEPRVRSRLAEAGLPVDDDLLVRRVIPAKGRHRCYVNGHLASLGLLSDLAQGLARVMSQHEQHSLLDSAAQLEMLDGYGELDTSVSKMAKLYEEFKQAEQELDNLKQREHDRTSRLDYLSYQLSEIERLAPEADELDDLDQRIERMRHQELLSNTARAGAGALYEDSGSIFERLGILLSDLEKAARYDKEFAQSADNVEEAGTLVEEAARFLSSYSLAEETDAGNIVELEDRREDLAQLVRKHGCDLAGVCKLQDSLSKEVETLSQYEEAINNAQATVETLLKAAKKQAASLTRARKKASRKLSRTVSKELGDLEFKNAVFEIQLEPSNPSLGPSGADRTEYRVALNPGEGTHPLRKVASGGELSRLMLALKRALAGIGPVGTYVFDEVDAGVGGAVAAAIGHKLKEVAGHHQVICITHLPQIAGMGDTHLYVSKKAVKGRTTTQIQKLDTDERVEELARMLGGKKVTDRTRAAARELMD